MSLVKDTLKAAMLDIALHGFDPTNRAKDWQYWLLYALLKSTPKPKAKPKSSIQEANPEEIKKYGLSGSRSAKSGAKMKKCKTGCK